MAKKLGIKVKYQYIWLMSSHYFNLEMSGTKMYPTWLMKKIKNRKFCYRFLPYFSIN